jgi:signal transduction histidine kinase
VLVQDAAFAHALVLSLRSGLLAVDGAGRIAALSADGARLLGIPARLGDPVETALAAHPAVLAQLAAARGGRLSPRAELSLQDERGEPRTIGFTALPVSGGGAAMLFRDLTPIERQGEQERLRARLAGLGQMAAGLAHELRNPLASIELLAGLLKRDLGSDPGALELIEEISQEVQTLAATVDACLAWVRPGVAECADFDPRELFAEALRRARARVPFDGDVLVSVEPHVRGAGDAAQLQSALENLIVNALQAMAAYPRAAPHRLELRALPGEPTGLSLLVCDSGPGVSLELRERIFFPFFTTRSGGSGIGLALVQKVAASHGGSVGVSERTGGGACFALHLPGEPPR